VFYYASKVFWFFATPSNLLPGLILAGLVLAARKRTYRFGVGLATASTALLLVAGLSPVANWVIEPLENRFPTYGDDGRPIAGVIVLGGGVQADESFSRGQVTLNEAGERVIALADLARRYPAAKILFSGGSNTPFEGDRVEADAVAHFAPMLGIPSERILIEAASLTTRENAVFSRDVLKPKPGERWLLVTSAWHMPRAVGCFRQVGFEVVPYPVDFRTSGPQDRWKFFAFTADGLRRLDLATKEWAGLIGYRLAGYITELFPR
jgi:uncharacterized SAM-binding protein YcdF (DUF218 family)